MSAVDASVTNQIARSEVERKPGFMPGVTQASQPRLLIVVVECPEGARGGGRQTSPALSSMCPYGGQPPE